MLVNLAYGEGHLAVEFPGDRTTVVRPHHSPGVADPMAALRVALRRPVAGPRLRDRVRRGQRVAIAACDVTRPQPRELMVGAVLAELADVVAPDDVVVLIATGTHRPNTAAEIVSMFGRVADHVRVCNHDARDKDSLVYLGEFGSGVPVWLNREWVAADIRITTGFVEPHFFAGFSGGPKLVAPGLAGLDTVLVLHDAARIGHPAATWGVLAGNPVHDDVRAIAAGTGVTFGLDVVLNCDREIVAAYGGDLLPTHAAAAATAKRLAMRAVATPFDVVVTTNSGYPLDQNLYQAVKGMSAAATVVRPGGVIVCAAECRDGFPDHGSYRQLITSASPAALLDEIAHRTHTVPDQWQIQLQARIQSTARVIMHTSYLSDAELAEAYLEQTSDIAATVRQLLDAAPPGSRVCVLPDGPQTIPYLDGGGDGAGGGG